ncbi:MAG: carboxypeptidase-like regulatory domain-containing protein [Kofleriaceae bacterium]
MSAARTRKLVLAGGVVVAIVTAGLITRWQRSWDAEPVIVAGDGGAAIQAPKPPRLPGDPTGVRLTGIVVDGMNAPVTGAIVSAELERGAADRALSTTPLGDAGVAVTVDAGVPVGPIAAPATAVDGRFAIEGLVAGRHRIRVVGPGLLPAEVRFVPVPSDEARIVVARQVSIEGTVSDAGAAAPNVTVGVRGEAIGGAIEAKSDAKGAFKFADLPEGRYQLYAWQGTHAARAIRVNRLGAGPFQPVALTLELAAIVVGRVIDREEGTGLIAAIELRPSGDDQAPRYARSKPDGSFRIEGVPNGRWIADAFSPGFTSPGGIELDAGHGVSEIALARGATLEGRVVDSEGAPIANAAVRALGTGSTAPEYSAAVDQDRLRRFSGRIAAPAMVVTAASGDDPQLLPRGELGVMVGPIPPIPPPGAQIARPTSIVVPAGDPALTGEVAALAIDPATASIWITGADGRFRIRGLPRGKVAVLATATGFAEGKSKTVDVGAGQALGNVDVILSAGTLLAGKVTDQHGVRVAGAQVHAKPELGAPIDTFTDENGMYKLGPLSGTVELTASAYGHGDAKRTLEISLAGGKPGTPAERLEDIVLDVADAVLAGTLDDTAGAPVPAAQIEIISGAGDGRRAIVGADGTFSIDLLPAGALRVRVSHPDYPTVELDAAASSHDRQRVRLRIPLGGAIEGALLDSTNGAPLAGLIISAYGPGGATTDTTSGNGGHWKLGPLRPGRWKLTIEQPGYLPTSRELDVPAARTPGGTSVHDVRFDLVRGAVVGGIVRDSRGQRVGGAAISVQAASGDGPTVTGTTDPQGEFRIRDAPTGELAVVATKADARGATRVTIRSGDEILGLAIELR